MSQPHILLVDLPDRAESFTQALAKVGRKAEAISTAELEQAFEILSPIAIVAPYDRQSEVAEQIRAVSPEFQFPVFVLEKKMAGSMRPLLPEITARLPDDVDPGILAMRLQIALQNSHGTYSRRQTVVGIPSVPPSAAPPAGSTAPGAPSRQPPTTLSGQPVTGATLRGSAPAPTAPEGPSPSQPATSPFPTSIAPSSTATPPPSPPAESNSATSTAPGIAPPAEGSAPSAGPVPSSAEPTDEATGAPATNAPASPFPSAPAAQAPPETSQPGEASQPPVAVGAFPSSIGSPFPPETPSSLGPEVSPDRGAEMAPGEPSEEAGETFAAAAAPSLTAGSSASHPAQIRDQNLNRSRLLRYGGIAAGVLVVLIGGGSMFAGSEDGDAEAETAALETKERAAKEETKAPAEEEAKPAGAAAPAATSPTSSTSGGLPTQEEADAAEAEGSPAAGDAAESESGKSAGGEAAYFEIDNPVEGKSCEEALGHPAQYFAKTAKWRSGHAWKLARKNLVAGHEEEAHKQMCRSAFIDVRGPGTSGLVKYYLSQRALGQALIWAKAGTEAKEGGRAEASAMQLLGDVLIQMGKIEEAKQAWLEGLGITEEDVAKLEKVCSTFYTSALKTRRGGDSHFAEQLLRRAAAFQTDNPAIAAELAKTLQANEQPKLARLWAERALSKDGSNEVAKGVLAAL